MVAQAPAGPHRQVSAAPLPLAFLGRTSTAVVQDPVSSMRRQARSAQEKAPPGSFIAAWFWDIESGGMDLEQRGHGSAHERFDVGIPRDGGIADLLAEAAGPNPRFAAVICEDIERSGRDTFNALKLERHLADAGIPLLAADEPIDLEGMNATTILVRRVKQGVAEWYRFQIKEKAWKGLARARPGRVEHRHPALRVHRRAHPAPGAGQGRPRAHQGPPGPRPGPRPRGGADLHLAHRGPAGDTRDHRPAERRPPRLPARRPRQRMDPIRGVLDPGEPQVHRVHGVRPPPHPRRQARPPGTPRSSGSGPRSQTHPAIITRATWDAAQVHGRRPTAPAATTRPCPHTPKPGGPTCCAAWSGAGPASGACTGPSAPPPATTRTARMWTTPTTGAPTTPPTPPTMPKPPATPRRSASAKTCC